MCEDLSEQACWLALVFESRLPIRAVNDILVVWCKQLGHTLQDFFAAGPAEWAATCQLKAAMVEKLEKAKEKLVRQAFLVEQLQHEHIKMVMVLDADYPRLLKATVSRSHIPPVLFTMGDLDILNHQTIAIIGSRNANETSRAFTWKAAQYLAGRGANVISGNARGVDRSAYEGATSTDGYTTIVLPHGIHKLSKAQKRALQPKIEAGKVLLLSQFHPDAPWLVSRAMARNHVVTGLAQGVIVAESDDKGGTWEGANNALKQGCSLYVRQQAAHDDILPGNKLLIEKGGHPLQWPAKELAVLLAPILQECDQVLERQQDMITLSDQFSSLAISEI